MGETVALPRCRLSPGDRTALKDFSSHDDSRREETLPVLSDNRTAFNLSSINIFDEKDLPYHLDSYANLTEVWKS
jgi:hypothetical protein